MEIEQNNQNQQEGVNQPSVETQNTEPAQPSFEEILGSNKGFQSEFDRRI